MNSVFDWLARGESAASPLQLPAVLLSLCLALLGGHVFGWVYLATREERPLSRAFVGSLLVLPVLVALVMLVLQNNLVIAFGLMSVFAIVRFRNVLDDTQDTTHVLAAIVVGLAAGTQRHALALLAIVLVAALFLYTHHTGFGTRRHVPLVLTLHWTRPADELADFLAALHRLGRGVHCTSHRARETGGTDLAYRIALREPGALETVLGELRAIPGVTRLAAVRGEEDKP